MTKHIIRVFFLVACMLLLCSILAIWKRGSGQHAQYYKVSILDEDDNAIRSWITGKRPVLGSWMTIEPMDSKEIIYTRETVRVEPVSSLDAAAKEAAELWIEQ